MKKIYVAMMFILLVYLVGCTSTLDLLYSDNEPIVIEMRNEDLKILK